jgi:hypothetical protein
LETLNKDQSETESKSPRVEEDKKDDNPEERKTLNTNNERSTESNIKTKCYCAINEKELNKVELAYFKRPTNAVILSDKYKILGFNRI